MSAPAGLKGGIPSRGTFVVLPFAALCLKMRSLCCLLNSILAIESELFNARLLPYFSGCIPSAVSSRKLLLRSLGVDIPQDDSPRDVAFTTARAVEGLTPVILCSLAAAGEMESLRQIIEEDPNIDVSTPDYDQRTPLHLCTYNSSVPFVRTQNISLSLPWSYFFY